jgi:hypothetical protein
MKLDYARILTKNFVNKLDNCFLNPTPKIFEKKQEQSVTSYRAVVSYGKLKLLCPETIMVVHRPHMNT